MLRRGITLTLAAILLITSSNAIQLKLKSKQVTTNTPSHELFTNFFISVQVSNQDPTEAPGDTSALPEPPRETVTWDQIERYRDECCQYIQKDLDNGIIDEQEAQIQRGQVDNRMWNLINEYEMEQFYQDIEDCVIENEHSRDPLYDPAITTGPPEPTGPQVPQPTEAPIPDPTKAASSKAQHNTEARITLTEEEIEEFREACTHYVDSLLEQGEISEEKAEESRVNFEEILQEILDYGDSDLYYSNLSRCS
ncbi:UNKNOWN [Stylonychia lemnae]|uniref:Uncharacterized protein n=1 Tax=Stylonychia lemnae TaxID=5949 RepID=A0A078AAC0_STYLE|nr:UNKNOWN [Stylonychia lemnae]|eukprot:CDW78821.1 UNKNOWN [Stylonychia lemnae]